jgi:diacylglycerol kinase family enzyme
MTRYYVNGIGYGIDGMVCEVADKMKAEGKTDINYASLSIKLLLHGYKCPMATAVVDGKEYHFKKVWLCSAMNGRYYGGGMKIAPGQNRLGDTLSLSVIHNAGKLRTLLIFPKIFKGEHAKNKKMSTILTGKKITVTFTHPMALQIDGETVKNVTTYTVEA